LLQDPAKQIVGATVEAELAFGPENLGVPRDEIRARIDRVVARAGIRDLVGRETAALSGGERQLVATAGARILLHTFLQDAEVVDGRVVSILAATKAGLARIAARTFVDASGDADLCHFAGFGYEMAGELDPAQTLTTTFRMANVDRDRRRTIGRDELQALMVSATADGYDLPRREGSDHVTPVVGVTATIMTRLEPNRRGSDGRLVNTTDPDFLTASEVAGRRQALEYARFLVDRVPGYKGASLVALGTQIGIRETRRVFGDARLTREDVLGTRQFDDQIGLCGAPIEDHRAGPDTRWTYIQNGDVVGIPYATLVVRDAVNVLVAGRCFSATHDAHASVRSMAQCMAMGQAAGTAAAMVSVEGGAAGAVRNVPPEALRTRLAADGAILGLAAESRT